VVYCVVLSAGFGSSTCPPELVSSVTVTICNADRCGDLLGVREAGSDDAGRAVFPRDVGGQR
jgi:hypothetical protein